MEVCRICGGHAGALLENDALERWACLGHNGNQYVAVGERTGYSPALPSRLLPNGLLMLFTCNLVIRVRKA